MKKILIGLVLLGSLLYANMVVPAKNKLYLKECGSCHFAFQPGLLPQRSWSKLMGNLNNHFKVDASLDATDRSTLLAYLTKNSSEHSNSYLSRVMTKYINKNKTPLRITETLPFMRWHDEISDGVFKRKSIVSSSNCIACHSLAPKGNYNEDYVRIPR